jgi:long-subunit fatty acid transport protein
MQGASNTFFPRGLAIIDWGNLAAQESQLAMTDPDLSSNAFNSFSSDAEATRNERFIGCAVGGAYKFNQWISASLGARYIYYSGNMNIRVKNVTYVINGVIDTDPNYGWRIDTDYTGHGATVIYGMHFRPLKGLNIGFKYEYHSPAVIVKKTNHLQINPLIETSGNVNIYKDGRGGREMEYSAGNGERTFTLQYPMQFNVGISYNILDNVRVEASAELTLRRLRDMDGREDDYEDAGYRLGAAIEWRFIKNVGISIGYCYNEFGIKEGKRDEADSLLPSHSMGGGLVFTVTDRFDLNVGASYEYFIEKKAYYKEYSNVSMPINHYLSKSFNEYRISVAIGLCYRFLGSK